MQSEQAYYFAEFVRFAFGVLPIGLLLLAMIFLRRRQRTSGTLRLTWLSAVWLLAAVANRLVTSRLVGVQMFSSPTDTFASPEEGLAYMASAARVAAVLNLAELVAFTLYALAVLIYFRAALPCRDVEPGSI